MTQAQKNFTDIKNAISDDNAQFAKGCGFGVSAALLVRELNKAHHFGNSNTTDADVINAVEQADTLADIKNADILRVLSVKPYL